MNNEDSLVAAPDYYKLQAELQAALTEVAHLRDALHAAEVRNESLLRVVADLVAQHCAWEDAQIGKCYFHMFIGADEDAFEALENAGWLREVERELYVFTDRTTNEMEYDNAAR